MASSIQNSRGAAPDCQEKINALYALLGYEVYTKHAGAPLPGTEDIIAELDALRASLAGGNAAASAARACPYCGAQVARDAVFCTSCGTKLG